MKKPGVGTTFIYALVMAGLAFLEESVIALMVLCVTNMFLAITVGRKRFLYILALASVGIVGVFVNALFFANTGDQLISVWWIIVRTGVVQAAFKVSLKLLLIAGAGGVFFYMYTPAEIARAFFKELGFPPVVAFPLFYAIRMMPVVVRDFGEVRNVWKMRRKRLIPLYPPHVSALLSTLLAIGLEKALWSGVAAELRGYSSLTTRRSFKLGLGDVVLIALLVSMVLICVFAP